MTAREPPEPDGAADLGDLEPLDRSRLEFFPLARRQSKFAIEEIAVDPDAPAPEPGEHAADLDRLARRLREARDRGRPVLLCHGAHLIKNGLGPVVIRLVEEGWVQHVATNGAGSIHDWEFGFQGRSCEDVRDYVAKGQFGIWDETGRWIGLALLVGGLDRLGYGASVGRLMVEEKLSVPRPEELRERLRRAEGEEPARLAAAADLFEALSVAGVEAGDLEVPHPWSRWSVQAACRRLGVPFTVHPGVGQDIVHVHPFVRGGALGRAAMLDFRLFAATVARLSGGVYLSVGSSVMSPMVFEKSVSMARNLARQEGRPFEGFAIAVDDLAETTWDWSRGEPPADHAAYYVRYCKSFSRMGGDLTYFGLDNRAFLVGLYERLRTLG